MTYCFGAILPQVRWNRIGRNGVRGELVLALRTDRDLADRQALAELVPPSTNSLRTLECLGGLNSAPDTKRLSGRVSGKVIAVTPQGAPGNYAARLEGSDEILCVSRTPFLTAARELLKRGYDPSTAIVMRRAGSSTECLRSSIGAAAKLAVREDNGPPQFTEYTPPEMREVPARTAATEPAATYPASQPELPL